VIAFLTLYVLAGRRRHIRVRLTSFWSFPAIRLMGEVWTLTHKDLIALTQNYGSPSRHITTNTTKV
jgi:hypothetical protein